jgi:hypothetical protein
MLFESTPNFLYPDFKVSGKVKLSKNLFRRVRARDSFNAVYSSAKEYTILPGERPDSLSFKAYNDPRFFWTILLLNNITNMNTEWPVDSDELDNYILAKYGTEIDKPRHWETNEIKDSYGNIVLEGGVVVELFTNSTEQNTSNYYPKIFNAESNEYNSWSFTYLHKAEYEPKKLSNGDPNPKANMIIESSIINKTITAAQNLTKITNREYEYELNELKRIIYLPTKSAAKLMESEIESLLAYDTQYKITDEGYRISEKV